MPVAPCITITGSGSHCLQCNSTMYVENARARARASCIATMGIHRGRSLQQPWLCSIILTTSSILSRNPIIHQTSPSITTGYCNHPREPSLAVASRQIEIGVIESCLTAIPWALLYGETRGRAEQWAAQSNLTEPTAGTNKQFAPHSKAWQNMDRKSESVFLL